MQRIIFSIEFQGEKYTTFDLLKVQLYPNKKLVLCWKS